MEVKSGYKQTEVGVIPEDWKASTIGAEADLLTGFPFSSANFVASGVRLLRGSNVKRGAIDWGEDITKHWPWVTPQTQGYKLQDGDVVIAMDGALVGRSYAVITADDLPALLVQRVARLRSHTTDLRLIGEWIGSQRFVRHVDSVKTHTAIPHISPRDIRGFGFSLPKERDEQRAIAEALSDVDGLLGGLDRLIAKKRDLKQAAMQRLLTGQTRLPGFHGEWELKTVSQMGMVVTGGTPSTQNPAFWNGTTPWITPTDISNHRDMVDSERMITEAGLRTIRSLPANSVLVTCIASIGKNAILRTAGGCNQQINAVVPKDSNDPEFLYYLFERSKSFLLANAGITATNIISKATFEQLSFAMPSPSEQRTIGEVLTKMDMELAALEQRREKTRGLKQAMMQELLTGKTRLV